MEDEKTMNPTPEPGEYEKPEIVDYGDLVELTAGSQAFGVLDGTFPRPPTTFS
jgi:hypothetical protein